MRPLENQLLLHPQKCVSPLLLLLLLLLRVRLLLGRLRCSLTNHLLGASSMVTPATRFGLLLISQDVRRHLTLRPKLPRRQR